MIPQWRGTIIPVKLGMMNVVVIGCLPLPRAMTVVAFQGKNQESDHDDDENVDEIGPKVTVLDNLDLEDIECSLHSCQEAVVVEGMCHASLV